MRIAQTIALFVALTGTSPRAATPQAAASRKYVPKPTDFAVVCTLFDRSLTGANVVPEEPITYDAHFVVGARIEHTKFGKSPWVDGALINFVIHSPALLLGGRAFSGHRFLLTFSPFRSTTDSDKTWFAPETRYVLSDIESMDLSAASVAALIAADGARSTLRALHSQNDKWMAVLRGVASGTAAWLKVATQLRAVSDAGAAEELDLAVGEALEHRPANVLSIAVPAFALDSVCSAPDIDDPRYDKYQRAIQAIELRKRHVTTVKAAELVTRRDQCIAALERSKSAIARLYRTNASPASNDDRRH